MSKLSIVCGAAAIICVVASTAASAQEREPVRAGVTYADLNLATAEGQAAFKSRVHRVALLACDSGEAGLGMATDRSRCMSEMEHDGEIGLAAITAARSTELASVTVTKRPAK